MSDFRQAISFAAGIYRERTGIAYQGYVRRDEMALLQLRPGRLDPYTIYSRIRRGGSLVPNRSGGWITASHRVCNLILRNRSFGVRPPGANHPSEAVSFLGTDSPDHTRLRRLVTPPFAAKTIPAYSTWIEETADRLLDRVNGLGTFDLVSAFAAPLPITVIAKLLGIPDARSEDFARYGAVLGSAIDGIKSLRHAKQVQVNEDELRDLFVKLIEVRKAKPQDDIISRLAVAEGDQLQSGEMLPTCMLLLIAGLTPINQIGNGIITLMENPGQWDALCADPKGMAAKAAEESMRFDPPIQDLTRYALETVEIDGKVIEKGQPVAILLAAANRDPEVYLNPDAFDIHRPGIPEHLAFSNGIHTCLAPALARLETAIALRVLAERLPGLHITGRVRRRNTTAVRGPVSVPVTVGSPRKASTPLKLMGQVDEGGVRAGDGREGR